MTTERLQMTKNIRQRHSLGQIYMSLAEHRVCGLGESFNVSGTIPMAIFLL